MPRYRSRRDIDLRRAASRSSRANSNATVEDRERFGEFGVGEHRRWQEEPHVGSRQARRTSGRRHHPWPAVAARGVASACLGVTRFQGAMVNMCFKI